jgi:hypothetical protein
VAKATKNKKNKEGRHVGLDIYDLLIEARFDPDKGEEKAHRVRKAWKRRNCQ